MKIKKYSEVNYIPVKNNLKRDLLIETIILIIELVLVVALSIRYIGLGIDYETIKKENKELSRVVEMQKSIISDLQEDNMKLQEMIK